MYLAVDVGGTKTLVAVLNERGIIQEQVKFPTPEKYEDFLEGIESTLAELKVQDFKAGGIGVPGRIDRKHGVGISFGNLKWKNVPVQHDLERIAKCPFVIENDAKMAGLSEANLIQEKYSKALYITVSTGIGIALIVDQVIDANIGDGGGRTMLLPHKGKLTPWEDFASGHAIVERYGKRAEDIHDKATWSKICRDLVPGLVELIAVTQPEVIVFGGGVGTYFDRWGKLLEHELQKYSLPSVKLPDLIGASRPEQAVVYGCYDLAKQKFGHATADK